MDNKTYLTSSLLLFTKILWSMNFPDADRIAIRQLVVVQAAQILMSKQKSPNEIELEGCFYVLAGMEFPERLKLLLDYGMDPNLSFSIGTVLCCAIISEQFKNVKLLLKYGANVNLRSQGGYFQRTPLEAALTAHKIMYESDVQMVKLLLKKGADPNVTDKFGNSMLSLSVRNGGEFRYELCSLLLEYGADSEIVDEAVDICIAKVSHSEEKI